ncbi:MAG TPA: hypothetical protein VK659_20705 [Asanoa sp.]|nr:hypothetical protein [Asanoa sp.]
MAEQEAEAIRTLFGDLAGDLLMTSQEGCFGHNGAPTGADRQLCRAARLPAVQPAARSAERAARL